MSNKKKLLIFMPTYEDEGVIQAFQASVDSFYDLDVPNGYEADWVIGLDNPYGINGRHKNTLHQYQKIQQRVLDEGYDALVTFEHDMIVPKDGLIKLIETDAPVVYGLYMLRHGSYSVNAFVRMEGNPNFRKSYSHYPEKFNNAEKNGVEQVAGVGMGFTLFRREVLERFKFRKFDRNYPPDWAIAVDCSRAGVKQMCRFDVKCGHIETKNGLVIYPRKDGLNKMAKCKILKRFIWKRVYEKGTITDVPSEKVEEFMRGGLVQVISLPEDISAPAVKIVNKPSKRSTAAIKKKIAAKPPPKDAKPERDEKGRFVSKED